MDQRTSGRLLTGAIIGPFTKLCPFELKQILVAGGVATAYHMKPDNSDADTSGATFQVYDRIGDKYGYGRDAVSGFGGHGMRGVAFYDPGVPLWEAVWLPTLFRFELISGLSPGGNALGDILVAGSGGGLNLGPEITVYDSGQLAFSGRAHGSGVVGSRGHCVWMADTQHFEILDIWTQSRRCNALLAAAMAYTDTTATVNNVIPIDGGWSPVANSATAITVANTMGWKADNAAKCKIEWNTSAAQWELYQVACPASP
ncbi:MAG: hypothetical protein ABSG68_11420 [Thermoguttaceae bacterium]|jgi:hypothetical protein